MNASSSQQNFQRYQDIPSNLPQLYFDSIEDKTFTQIRIDMFSTAIRRNIEAFQVIRDDYMGKIEGKQVAIKLISDMN